jgi:LacI family transcriptional regulator
MKKATRGKVTVFDVAKKAGVSIATVSRSFSAPDVVRDDVRQNVLEIARMLGYSPNPAAKALRLQRTHIVGAIIPTLDYAIFARMIDSFQETLANFNYMTIVLSTGFDNSRIYDKVRLLVDRGAEALLLVGGIEDPDLRKYLKDVAIPVVTTYSYFPDEIVPSIGFDNYAATRSMMDYLLGLGHREFAMIAGSPRGNDRQRSRIQAFADSLQTAGLTGADRVLIRPFSIEDGATAMRQIRDQYPMVTAVVCNTDIFAFGVLSECRALGIKVPDQISVTGFDDADYTSRLDPPLTTIAVPAQEMGNHAALALHAALRGGHGLVSQCLDTVLKVRQSAARSGNPPLRQEEK